MGENRSLKRIGGKLREESRDIVEARLPERLRVLLQRLTCTEDDRGTTSQRIDGSKAHDRIDDRAGERQIIARVERNLMSSAAFKLQARPDTGVRISPPGRVRPMARSAHD